jgi:dihydroxyacetone kinase-like predicted kinase
LIKALIDDKSELITVYYGDDVIEEEAKAFVKYIEDHYQDCDVELHRGGQPLYYYILSVE